MPRPPGAKKATDDVPDQMSTAQDPYAPESAGGQFVYSKSQRLSQNLGSRRGAIPSLSDNITNVNSNLALKRGARPRVVKGENDRRQGSHRLEVINKNIV